MSRLLTTCLTKELRAVRRSIDPLAGTFQQLAFRRVARRHVLSRRKWELRWEPILESRQGYECLASCPFVDKFVAFPPDSLMDDRY